TEDSINFISNLIVPGNGQASGLAIFQGGKYYALRNPILVMPYPSYSNWNFNPAANILATDMQEVTPAGLLVTTSHPNFSNTGGPITFGFYRGNSGSAGYTTDCGIDNWYVELVQPDCSRAGPRLLAWYQAESTTLDSASNFNGTRATGVSYAPGR